MGWERYDRKGRDAAYGQNGGGFLQGDATIDKFIGGEVKDALGSGAGSERQIGDADAGISCFGNVTGQDVALDCEAGVDTLMFAPEMGASNIDDLAITVLGRSAAPEDEADTWETIVRGDYGRLDQPSGGCENDQNTCPMALRGPGEPAFAVILVEP